VSNITELPTAVRFAFNSNESVQVTATAGQHVQAHAEITDGAFELLACHVSGKLV
jgi:hypothetical protein